MQFNSDSDDQDIVSLINDLTGQDDNSYVIKKKTRHANWALSQIWSWIFDAYGGAIYDDSNNTNNFPSSTDTLTSGRDNYPFPSEALEVRGVDVKANNSGEWYPLVPITEDMIRQGRQSDIEFQSTDGQPKYYSINGRSIRIYPASNYTQAASWRVTYTRGSTKFASTDTTKTPGFVSEFHDAVAIGAALMFAKAERLRQKNDLEKDWLDYKQKIQQFYQRQYHEMFPPKIRVPDYYRNNI
jgi:hypothetical protein